MKEHRQAEKESGGIGEVAATLAGPYSEEESLKNIAISAIMEMDIQDVAKYLSYIKDGRI